MTVSLIIPFASEDIRRLQIFDWVEARWDDVCPGFELCVGHDDPKDFNRSKARNRAYEESSGDIIVISDADTACPVENVLGALRIVENDPLQWVIAHTEYFSLTEAYTDWLITQSPGLVFRPPFPHNWRMVNKSQAGVIVMDRAAYESAGGYNEEFISWGYEDNEFAVRMTQKIGPPTRVFGPMLHLHHPRGLDFDQPDIEHNRRLYERATRGEER